MSPEGPEIGQIWGTKVEKELVLKPLAMTNPISGAWKIENVPCHHHLAVACAENDENNQVSLISTVYIIIIEGGEAVEAWREKETLEDMW